MTAVWASTTSACCAPCSCRAWCGSRASSCVAEMADRVVVTGASGFVGSAVARALVARGFDVRAVLRSTSPRANVENIGCEIVEGDMRDKSSMLLALQGARYLFHVAADYRLWARDPGEIVRNNLEGTRA